MSYQCKDLAREIGKKKKKRKRKEPSKTSCLKKKKLLFIEDKGEKITFDFLK